MHICDVYTHYIQDVCIYIYMCVYIYRERERKREIDFKELHHQYVWAGKSEIRRAGQQSGAPRKS